ncbi:RDD family protein [Micromonospora sp. NPDC049679]|uniref:RDD family protein n=1 Tax=Micromonospora sp. NPDC049679 TaxID=3155920 RepID=UPI0033CCA380
MSSPAGAPPEPANGAAPPPSLARRFAALLVDWALCVLFSGLIGNPSADGWPPVVVLIAEYAFFIGLFAQTPGMWVAKIRCVSYGDGSRIGVIRAMLRGVLLCLVIPALLMDGRRRGLHDRVVGSVIVPASSARS